MRFLHTILATALFFGAQALAEVKVKSMDFRAGKSQGSLIVGFDGKLKRYPELKVSGSMIQVLIPDSSAQSEIERKVSFASAAKDTSLSMGRFADNSTRIKAVFPFNVAKHRDKVALMIKENKIELNFPKAAVSAVSKAPAPKQRAKKSAANTKSAKEYLDEDYLNSLIDVEDKNKGVAAGTVIRPKADADEVKTALSGNKKGLGSKDKSSFSLLEYGGKFVAFLAVTILLFYGIVTLMKKGFIKKGKLGFLNKTGQIEVLSQTHIAPKKTLMMVRAHNQVFLVSNTDSGIHPISEIRDVAGFLKEGEKKIAGDNFDDNLGAAKAQESVEEKVRLKDDITKSNRRSSLSSYAGVKDKVKFSDQIKKKAKGLKPLH